MDCVERLRYATDLLCIVLQRSHKAIAPLQLFKTFVEDPLVCSMLIGRCVRTGLTFEQCDHALVPKRKYDPSINGQNSSPEVLRTNQSSRVQCYLLVARMFLRYSRRTQHYYRPLRIWTNASKSDSCEAVGRLQDLAIAAVRDQWTVKGAFAPFLSVSSPSLRQVVCMDDLVEAVVKSQLKVQMGHMRTS